MVNNSEKKKSKFQENVAKLCKRVCEEKKIKLEIIYVKNACMYEQNKIK